MFIANSRFYVRAKDTKIFEKEWDAKTGFLFSQAGLIMFDLLRGPQTEDKALYVCHSVWKDKRSYLIWTSSVSYSKIHNNEQIKKFMLSEEPIIEAFEQVPFFDKAS
tara:strand:- start:209 stop:529 length:321 start_codon:yes stop_codon:yes gene_type:complete